MSTIRVRSSYFILAVACMILSAGAGYAQSASTSEKKPICGLVSMGFIGRLLHGQTIDNLAEVTTHPGIYSAIVLNYSWRQLEPSQGQFDFSAIDRDMSAVHAYNAAHPRKPITIKLRISPGIVAPEWVKQLAGTMSLNHRNDEVVIGRFWMPIYRQAWRDFLAALAARYDANPLVQEVAISSCGSVTDEPFNLSTGPENAPVFRNSGLTDAQYKACLFGALDDYAVWHSTPLDFTFNPFMSLDGRSAHPDSAFTISLMEAFREKFGRRAVLANHGLVPTITARQSEIYQEIAKLGPPVEFQTGSSKDNFDATWQNGLQFHPSEYEMWVTKDAGGVAPATPTMLQHWASELSCPQ